jgi:hypothetical protein
MRALWEALPEAARRWAETAETLAAKAHRLVDAGDVVLVKGSKGSKVSLVVDAIRKLGHAAPPRTGDLSNALLADRILGRGDFFNLFRYITFRAGGAFFTALFFGFIFGAADQRAARKQGKGQPIRDDGPKAISPRRARPRWAGS